MSINDAVGIGASVPGKCKCGNQVRLGLWRCDHCIERDSLLQGQGRVPHEIPFETREQTMLKKLVADVLERLRMGKISQEQACKELDFPTLDKVAVDLTGPVTAVMRAIDPLPDEQRLRVLRAVAVLYGVKGGLSAP